MEPSYREKFQMVRGEDAAKTMLAMFDPEALPAHLGGTSQTYTSTVDIIYNGQVRSQ